MAAELRARFELHRQDGTVQLDALTGPTGPGSPRNTAARVLLVRSTDEYREQARILPRELARPALLPAHWRWWRFWRCAAPPPFAAHGHCASAASTCCAQAQGCRSPRTALQRPH